MPASFVLEMSGIKLYFASILRWVALVSKASFTASLIYID